MPTNRNLAGNRAASNNTLVDGKV